MPAHGLKLIRDSRKSDQVGAGGLLLESPLILIFTEISDWWYWATIITSNLLFTHIHDFSYHVLFFFIVPFGFIFNFMIVSPPSIFNIYYPSACI